MLRKYQNVYPVDDNDRKEVLLILRKCQKFCSFGDNDTKMSIDVKQMLKYYLLIMIIENIYQTIVKTFRLTI